MLQNLNRFFTKYQLTVEAALERKLCAGRCGSICQPQFIFTLDQKR